MRQQGSSDRHGYMAFLIVAETRANKLAICATQTALLAKGEVRTINDRNICERRSCMKNNGKSPTFKFVLERRDARRKFSESLRDGAPMTPRTRQRIPLGSENDWKFRLRSCQSWKASSLSLGVVVPTSINKYRMRYIGLGRDNLRSHFVFRPRHAPE